MAFDRISEEIAHFIGLFHLEIEGNRLRLEYEAFSVRSRENDRTFEKAPDLAVTSPHLLEGFDPGLVYLRPPVEMPPPLMLAGDPHFPVDEGTTIPPLMPDMPESNIASPVAGGYGGIFVPLPNSILVTIQQTATLYDNDVFLVTGDTEFLDPSQLVAELQDLVLTAHSLQAPSLSNSETIITTAVMNALATEIDEFSPSDEVAEVQLLLKGEAAQGMYLNGEALLPAQAENAGQATDDTAPADTEGELEQPVFPGFRESLPAYLSQKLPDPEPQDTPEKDAFALPLDPTLQPPIDLLDVDPGHKVVTGGNVSINEVAIYQAWVDAPVIAVAGDAIRLDIVSQVNLRKEALHTTQPEAEILPSTALNAVSFAIESSANPAQTKSSDTVGQFPQAWNVARVEGDLVAINWVQQHVFATDFDRAEIAISAAATFISMGENVITNVAQLRESGFHYDLILTGGDMITLNQVHQVNVMLDVDTVDTLSGKGAKISAGDNLQYNLAEIKQTGRDEMVAMKDHFQKSLDDMADGKREIAQDVLKDSRFEGKSALKVLQIEGDLIKANILEQKNYLGDSDQIKLMLEGFLAAGDGIEFITGSNAQLNSARLIDNGLDSEIMVAGSAYSDALIYQAQLLDDDAPPTGVALSPLATEAIAFLVDDMISAKREMLETAQVTQQADTPASSDILLAMTA